MHNVTKRVGGTPIIAGQLVRVRLTVKQTWSHSVKSAVRTAVAENTQSGLQWQATKEWDRGTEKKVI